MDRKFSDEVIGLGAVYVRVPSSDELVEKLKEDKEFLDAVRGELAKKVGELEERVKALEPEENSVDSEQIYSPPGEEGGY